MHDEDYADDVAPTTTPAVEWTQESVLEQLRKGLPVRQARIARLKLTGEFTQPVILERVTVDQFSVTGATFAGGLNLKQCDIASCRINGQVVVRGDLDLRGCRIGRLELSEIQIERDLRLDGITASGLVRLNLCRVTGSVRLWQARFREWLEFNGCTVAGKGDLRSFHAEEGVIFRECHFATEFLLRGSTITKKLEFVDCRMDGLTDFSKAKLHDVAYLDGMIPGPDQCFAFENAFFSRLLIEPDKLKGRLVAERHGHHRAAMMEYGLLKQNYQNLNRYDDEDWAFYRFKVNQRKVRSLSWLRPWTLLLRIADFLLLDVGCGYGTKPFRAVGCGAVLMTFFASLYALGIAHLDMPHPPLAELPVENPVNRVLFGLMTSISVFTGGFSGEHLRSAEGWILIPLTLEALIGTLLWGLFVVAFSRKVIR